MPELMKVLNWVAYHPWLGLWRGFVLITGALFEAFETGIESVTGDITFVHTFLVLGVVEVVRALPDVIEGAQSITETRGRKDDS
jgi:hypothetical protein